LKFSVGAAEVRMLYGKLDVIVDLLLKCPEQPGSPPATGRVGPLHEHVGGKSLDDAHWHVKDSAEGKPTFT
jgi:hypothetical protein